MEPRLRAGLIAGGGAAAATFLFSLIFICATGPLIAALGGFNAGMQIGRNPHFAARAGSAGAIAGLYAGLIIGLAQIPGMFLASKYVEQPFVQQNPTIPVSAFWGTYIVFTVLICLLEVGISVACGAWGASWAAKRTFAAQAITQQRTRVVDAMSMPPVAPRPRPIPTNAAQHMPPPPAAYPPPPSYYGLPDNPPSEGESSLPEKM